MNKRANLYFAALLGAMSPLSTVTALAAQSNSTIATATQQQNSCKGTVKGRFWRACHWCYHPYRWQDRRYRDRP